MGVGFASTTAVAAATHRGILERRMNARILPSLHERVAELERHLSVTTRAKEKAEKDASEKTDLIFDLKDKVELLEVRLARYEGAKAFHMDVVNEVSVKRNTPIHVMMKATRRTSIVYVRHEAMYEVHRRCGVSASEIGRIFGGLDHTTVLSAIKNWPKRAVELGLDFVPLEGGSQ